MFLLDAWFFREIELADTFRHVSCADYLFPVDEVPILDVANKILEVCPVSVAEVDSYFFHRDVY